jgi:hypothetical protein
LTKLKYHQTNGFSLIEVLVAVVMMFLMASSVLGLLGFHKSNASRVSDRLWIHERALALSEELPFILREMDEEFPILEEDQKVKEYEGTTDNVTWKAYLTRTGMAGLPPFYKLQVMVYRGDYEVQLTRYLLTGREQGR